MSGYPKRNILLTSDDGAEKIDGLYNLYLAFGKKHNVTVVTPLYEQSGQSQSITLLSPIFINKANGFYYIKGTPTDCVKISFGYLLKKLPNFVVSGINLGANVGLDVFYSGTVAAAIEASFWGVTSFAVSVERKLDKKKSDFKRLAKIAREIIENLIKTNPPKGSIFNINIPHNILSIKGIKFTKQDTRFIKDGFIKGVDPRGRDYFWMRAGYLKGPDKNKSKKIGRRPFLISDLDAIRNGYISITPLKPHCTNESLIAKYENNF